MNRQKTLDETLTAWSDIAKQRGGHIYWLPSSKKIINDLCVRRDISSLLKVYICLQEVHQEVLTAGCCDDNDDCRYCTRRKDFLRLLINYMQKIQSSINT